MSKDQTLKKTRTLLFPERSGHGCPRPNACLSRASRACPKFLTQDVRTPQDVRGTSGPKTFSLGCLFSFLSGSLRIFRGIFNLRRLF